MRHTVKVIGSVIVAVAVAGAAVAVSGLVLAKRKLNRVVKLDVAAVTYAEGDAAIRRGQYLFESRGCAECHGADARGKLLINDSHGMFVKTPNLTRGPGGVAARYRAVDWVRTLRHGVKPDGHPLRFMPAEIFNRLTDDDLAAIVAYVRSLPPRNGSGAEIRFPVMYKILYGLGVIEDAAQRIDHNLPPSLPVPVGPTAAYGAYVSNMCVGCHGAHFSGGRIVGGSPDWPPAANLTPGEGSVMPRYASLDLFKAMFRSGRRPDGSPINPAMPFESLAMFSDTDIAAVYTFLKTLPPLPAGSH